MRIIEMSSHHIPISLVGENLGERHRDFNARVSESIRLGEPVDDILELQEKSAIDRLFKIDLASKQKHVQYILKNMKEDDMLYVSRALKAKWLLEEEYKDIINPVKLESDVYPEMILPAVNKMKHWIHLNLRDEERCQEFYHYYRDTNPRLAMKYLLKCPTDLITKEVQYFFKYDSDFFYTSPQYFITPHYFKMFCERTPLVAKLVYDLIEQNKSFRLRYTDQQYEYFESLKCVLKTDPDTFLDIVEKHFIFNKFNKMSAVATRFIMTHRKNRFKNKPELYAAWLLDMKELARCLDSQECEKLVIQLARAKYLDPWFNFKNVEPLIKKIEKDKRVEFKKRVFVCKEVGEDVKDWPYPPPGAITEEVFASEDGSSDDVLGYRACAMTDKLLSGVGMSFYCGMIDSHGKSCERRKLKTNFDVLFDKYRFKSFSESLFDLSKKILAESIPRNRLHMMLVLISKSGGKEVNLEALIQFLMRHRNEPPQVKAAVIRSLVRRACVWRVSDAIWDNLLKFGEDLGLDGSTPEAECKEGLHAVVIRSLLKTGKLTPEIKIVFLKDFSPLVTEYTLSVTEKSKILRILPNHLLDSVNTETNGEVAADIMEHLLDTLKLTNTGVNFCNDVVPAVKNLLERDQTASIRILVRLFESNKGRKDLFKENFELFQRDDSYVNALKHDVSVLSIDRFLKTIVSENIDLDRFLRKISVYFAEDGGLASRLLAEIKKEKIHKNLARPITILIGSNLSTYILEMDEQRKFCKDDKEIEIFCAKIRANAHLARPRFDLNFFTWRQAGVKLVANRVLVCRNVDADRHIEQSLLWKRSARLATVLAKRLDRDVEVLKSVATMRPTVAIKVALEYWKHDHSLSPLVTLSIWKTIKPLISTLEPEDKNMYLIKKLEKFNHIPEPIRPDFIQTMFPLYSNMKLQKNNKLNYHSVLHHIHKHLPKMEQEFVDNLLLTFLKDVFIVDKKSSLQYSVHNNVGIYSDADIYVRILAKYLLLCKNENEQEERFARLADLFFDAMGIYLLKSFGKKTYLHYINIFLRALKSNSAYFSNEYVSCITVMHKVVKKIRPQPQLPPEEHFKLFVEIHLSMLYYISVKKSMKQAPNVFVGEPMDQKKNSEGMKIVAKEFGIHIARDVKDLTSKYFDSITELYSAGLKDYFLRFRESRFALSLPLVEGIVQGSAGFVGRLALDLYNEYTRNDEDWIQIRELMMTKFDKSMMFFFYHDVEEW